jgi:hypothetical protein
MESDWQNITEECTTYGPAKHDASRCDIGIAYGPHHDPIIRIDPTPHWPLEQRYRIRRIRIDCSVPFGSHAFVIERDLNFKG